MKRRVVLRAAAGCATFPALAWAHHGWSRFDQTRPIYLEGRARDVKWRNPHAEFTLELAQPLQLPADLARRPLPAQTADVDGRSLLARAALPQRSDRRWQVELAPLSRLERWQVPPIAEGTPLAVLGFTFTGEQGEPLLRAEYLFLGGKTYGLRSSPA